MGNAQNQYILTNNKAKEKILKKFKNVTDFYSWVRGLTLDNFYQFRDAWS